MEWNGIGLAIFGSFARKRPKSAAPVEFFPIHPAYLFAPLACYDEQPDDRAEARVGVWRCRPDAAQLDVGKPAVARFHRRRRVHSLHRADHQVATADRPAE